ncbi:hypothetical protein KDN32_15440 [Nocardioides sp. J2M5]|uniref:sigma factor n=1 Tax=Nocardioides palaemonis TaxID=2829810 RepID=UPI001BADB46A|nr:sigma factor [Nocardioides palaemonis]MBS2939133.1 hypothetical protein [Nocardioides palaemonis]
MAGRATPDDELLVRSGTADTAAFAELYDRLAPRVFGVVSCLVRDTGTAERISRDAFLEVWRLAATYDPATSGAAAWVLGVARRTAVPERRRMAVEQDRPAPVHAPDPLLLAAGLTLDQAGAVRLAWCDGLDHRSIEAELRSDQPATALLTGALRALTPAGGR